MTPITFKQLKRVIRESMYENNWEWCVADVSFGMVTPVTYQSDEPWPGDLSAHKVPRGYYIGYCQTLTREEADELLEMLEEYRDKYSVSRSQFQVLSREEFEERSEILSSQWKSEIRGV